MREKRGDDVSEQDQREPLENSGNATIGGPEKERDDQRCVDRRPDEMTDAGDHAGGFGHPAKIGSDVDDVRDHHSSIVVADTN